MGCSCKHSEAIIREYKEQIENLRNLFIKRMTIDSETNDRRKSDYNQAIFYDCGDGEYKQVFIETTMDMVLDCFDNSVKDWRRSFCDVDNCNRRK